MMELTILMPCRNEEATVAACIAEAKDYLARGNISGEILIADNASTDNSRSIAEAAGARVLFVPEPGYGNALRSGIRAARGRYIIMGDCDGSYDFSRPDAMLSALREGWELVLPMCLSNGSQGYFPMQDAYDEGGYEANNSRFKPGVAEKLIAAGKEVMAELAK